MAGGRSADPPPSAAVKVFSAGTAGCVADLVTFPLDTAKVRLQVRSPGELTPPAMLTYLLYVNRFSNISFGQFNLLV